MRFNLESYTILYNAIYNAGANTRQRNYLVNLSGPNNEVVSINFLTDGVGNIAMDSGTGRFIGYMPISEFRDFMDMIDRFQGAGGAIVQAEEKSNGSLDIVVTGGAFT